MDYQKLRKWLHFYQKEGVSAEEAIVLLAFYLRNLVPFSFVGLDEGYEGMPFSTNICPAKKDDDE